jgi:hypothetical protein
LIDGHQGSSHLIGNRNDENTRVWIGQTKTFRLDACCRVTHRCRDKTDEILDQFGPGMFVWSDGSVKELKRTILHNMAVAPGMDGDLKPADLDAVAAYVWAISHQLPPL